MLIAVKNKSEYPSSLTFFIRTAGIMNSRQYLSRGSLSYIHRQKVNRVCSRPSRIQRVSQTVDLHLKFRYFFLHIFAVLVVCSLRGPSHYLCTKIYCTVESGEENLNKSWCWHYTFLQLIFDFRVDHFKAFRFRKVIETCRCTSESSLNRVKRIKASRV